MATCEADYNAMLAQAENNRQKSIAEIEYALSRTSDDETAGKLQRELEHTYEIEERFRNMASVGYRDCISYVKAQGS